MSTEYISSLNGGQLSPLLDARTELPIYRSGCRNLRNFYVLPQGGVERRQGSQYLREATSSDSRLIPFIFTRDESYMIEVSSTDIKIFDGDSAVISTLTSPYVDEDLNDIKYMQIADILWLVSPNTPPQNIRRTEILPAVFEIANITFDYPPLLEENNDTNSTIAFQPLLFDETVDYEIGEQVTYSDAIYETSTGASAGVFDPSDWTSIDPSQTVINEGDLISLYSNDGVFNIEHEGSYWRTSHQRANETKVSEGKLLGNNGVDGVSSYTETSYIGGKNTTVYYRLWGPSLLDSTSSIIVETKEGVGGTWAVKFSSSTYASSSYIAIANANTYLKVTITAKSTPFRGDKLIDSNASYTALIKSDRRVDYSSATDGTTSDALDVSFSNWDITTGGTWNGSVELEKSTDGGGTWSIVTTILDTSGVTATNVTLNSPGAEGKTTLIRIKYVTSNATTMTANIVNTTLNSEELFNVEEYVTPNRINVSIIQPPINSYSTNKWSESAFSKYRGYPIAIELFNNRVVYSGTVEETNTVYMSYSDDYYNFLIGTNASDAIKAKPNTNEPTVWLLSRGNTLYQGTRGSVVSISSNDKQAITPSTITADEGLEFGGSPIQALKTNETVVFLERLNTKLREIVYSDDEQGLVSRDLTILSNEIASPQGFTQLVLQRTPDQIIYGLRSDGLLAGLTYERSQEVQGWAVMDLGGIVKSIAVRPTGSHDELWMIIERDGGHYIEKLGSRMFSDDLLDAWYVDSGKKTVLSKPDTTATINITDAPDGDTLVTQVGHPYVDGEKVRITDTDNTWLTNSVFTVGGATTDTFTLKTEDGSVNSKFYLDKTNLPDITIDGTGSEEIDGHTLTFLTYENDGTPKWSKALGTGFNAPSVSVLYDAPEWEVNYFTGNLTVTWRSNGNTEAMPPLSNWESSNIGSFDPPTLTYDRVIEFTGSSMEVSKIWSGFSHLNNESLQVQGDGGFAGNVVVDNNIVYTDAYYNQIVAGLRYLSIVQPMYIEEGGFASNRWNKSILDASISFYRTIGGYAGLLVQNDDRNPEFDFAVLNEDFPNIDSSFYEMEPLNFRDYTDNIGEAIVPFDGNKLVNYNDTYSRVKTQFIIQDIPMPMTVQGLAVNLKVG